jgi:hypothetical protein
MYGPWIACVLLPGAGDARPMHHVLTRPHSTLTDMKRAPCVCHTRSARDAAAEHWDTGSHRVSQSEQKQVDGVAREYRWAQVTAKTRSFLQPTHAPSVSAATQRSLPLLQPPHAHAVGNHLFSNRVLLAPSSTSSPTGCYWHHLPPLLQQGVTGTIFHMHSAKIRFQSQ